MILKQVMLSGFALTVQGILALLLLPLIIIYMIVYFLQEMPIFPRILLNDKTVIDRV